MVQQITESLMESHCAPVSFGLQVSILEMPYGLSRWNLVHDFLQFRKRVFIDEMDWQLNVYGGMEYEQYDTFDAVYVVAHRGDEVCGGARLRRTDAVSGTGALTYSYMIRDAHLGLLPGMPQNLCYETPPQSSEIWELTRLAASHSSEVTKAILLGANRFLAGKGASECYFLGWPGFVRMARSMKFSPRPLGPVVENGDGKFLAFTCPVVVN